MSTKTKSSQTALAVCLIRAASYLETIPALKSNDHLAHLFIPPLAQFLVKFERVRRFLQKNFPPGTYEQMILRTNYFDEIFSSAIHKNFDQIIILGAGYDSRGIRLAKNTKTRIIEVDMQSTQDEKRKKLGKKYLSPSVYIPLDLNSLTLEQTFVQNKIEKGKKTLFILEGLLMYLEPDAVDILFKTISLYGGVGSEVVFDYIYASEVRATGIEQETVSKLKEPWTFGIEKEHIPDFLKKYGFVAVEHFSQKDLAEKYFQGMPKPISIRLGKKNGIVFARKE